jgi:antitoxin component YwqK of YwqJK toxin-antitoxin module
MKKSVIFFFLLLNTVVFSQDPDQTGYGKTNSKGQKIGFWTYNWKIGGKFIAAKGLYTKGEKEGKWIYYAQPYNLRKTKEGSYVLGKKQGEWLEYYSSGELHKKESYSNGEKAGL